MSAEQRAEKLEGVARETDYIYVGLRSFRLSVVSGKPENLSLFVWRLEGAGQLEPARHWQSTAVL